MSPVPHCEKCNRQHETARGILVKVLKYFDRNPPTGPVSERIVRATELWFDCEDAAQPDTQEGT